MHIHLENCETTSNSLSDPSLLKLAKLPLKPLRILKEYNKNSENKIPETNANRKKISRLKYNAKKNEAESNNIYNLEDLKRFVDPKLLKNEEDLLNINYDEPFYLGLDEKNNDFICFATTKNLLLNLKKQSEINFSFLNIDGTYRLNELSYPTIVVGTVDNDRRFKLGCSINFFFLFVKLFDKLVLELLTWKMNLAILRLLNT